MGNRGETNKLYKRKYVHLYLKMKYLLCQLTHPRIFMVGHISARSTAGQVRTVLTCEEFFWYKTEKKYNILRLILS